MVEKKKGERKAGNMPEEQYDSLVERTLVVFKPDAVQRGIVGEILSRFERVGLKIVGCKMVNPDKDHYFHHYEGISQMISRRGQEAFDMTVEFMASGPVIAMVMEGIEAVALVRKIVGPTEPKSAEMGTVRGDYSHMSFGYSNSKKIGVPNLIHASGNKEEAVKEVEHWFRSAEMYEYEDIVDKFMR